MGGTAVRKQLKPKAAGKPQKAPEVPISQPTASDSEEEDNDFSEEEQIGEEDLKKVITLLGDDGLDEVGQMQLGMLNEDSEDEEDSDYSGEEGDSDDSQEEEGDESASDPEDAASVAGDDAEDIDDDAIELDAISDDAMSLDADVVPRQKIVIDNKACPRFLKISFCLHSLKEAMKRIRENFQLDPSLPWTETLVCTYPENIEVEDVNDDLNRELAL
jgi:rRNA-processing protein EBP2